MYYSLQVQWKFEGCQDPHVTGCVSNFWLLLKPHQQHLILSKSRPHRFDISL
jgi:hypothetical protein